ncbi:LysR substrate-binding domain-containing protein [Caenimonas soli]|uniref:LysR substrate-binding domain-containing protein n=1 Tax=Caenimonas soli TaxID=2735555 RepID=UPI00155418E3|nr:LysR substrate-binding domain-containing protein [Caenimonas soli]NPC58550.1 LysR family transcriptional regulator [Caenimonas soli]
MSINLRQIEVFRAIMLARSVSGAAKALHVSQPAISRLVSHTEQRLGFRLFERIKGRLYPTPEAERLFGEVDVVYSGVQRINQVAEDLLANRSAVLRVACTPNLSQSLLPRATSLFLRKHPEVRVILHSKAPQDLMQDLFAHRSELGIAYMPAGHPALAADLLYENRVLAAVPSGHSLAKAKAIRLTDLANEPFVGYSTDIPFGQLIRELFAGLDSAPTARVEVEQIHVACELADAGLGIALADEQTLLGRNWSNLTMLPLLPNVQTPVQVFYPLYKPLSRPAQDFVSILRSMHPARATALRSRTATAK